MSKPASLREFALAFRRHWFAAMSSGVGVPFAIMAVFVDIAWGQGAAGALAITAVAFAAYRVWSWERENWIEAEAKLRQRLSVSFIPEKEFYETTEPEHASGPALRTFRVSVKNDGPVTLEHCSERLESLIDANGINTRAGQRRFRQMLDQPISAPGWHKQDFILAPGRIFGVPGPNPPGPFQKSTVGRLVRTHSSCGLWALCNRCSGASKSAWMTRLSVYG